VTDPSSATRRSRVLRRVALVVALVVGLVLIAATWVGVRALLAKSELEALLPLVEPIKAAAADGDLESLRELATDAQGHAEQAAQLTGDPVWRAAEIVPWIGPNLAAVRTVSASLDGMASGSLPLLDVADAATTSDGSTDLAVLADAQGPLEAAAEAFAAADTALARIDPAPLLTPVAEGVTAATRLAAQVSPGLSSAAQAMGVIPGMIGLDGPRTILVALQNSAELRTGGGITGSFVLLTADAGRLMIVDQADSSDFPALARPIIELPEAITAIEGDDIGRFVQNASLTSDFAVTAELARAWWARYSDVVPDAVVSIDLDVIAALLTSAGPVELPDGTTVDSKNLLDRVLVEPYLTLSQEQQTLFQRLVTTTALDHILERGIDPLDWMSALAAPVAEGRVSLWSSVPDEQAIIADSVLGGPLARLDQAGENGFAAYLNDVTGGKMDSLLDVGIASGWAMCRADDRADVAIRITLTNTAPPAATSWPWSMTGGGNYGVPAGSIGTDVTVAAPPGTFPGGVTDPSGTLQQSVDREVSGHPSSRVRVVLAPGESTTLEFRHVAAEPGEPDEPIILHTPTMHDVTAETADIACG
jgi:hypothetical protein